jgi:hypothetical protein
MEVYAWYFGPLEFLCARGLVLSQTKLVLQAFKMFPFAKLVYVTMGGLN